MEQSKWGTCPWSYEFQKEKIHPDDVEQFKTFYGPFVTFECVGEEGDFIIIKCGSDTFRVKPEIFREIKESKYKIGDTIKINDINATIKFNEWHVEKREHYYYLT